MPHQRKTALTNYSQTLETADWTNEPREVIDQRLLWHSCSKLSVNVVSHAHLDFFLVATSMTWDSRCINNGFSELTFFLLSLVNYKPLWYPLYLGYSIAYSYPHGSWICYVKQLEPAQTLY